MSEFDVIVIGSGFGGSVMASRLTEAGKRVLVLERGPWRDTLPVRSAGIKRRARLPSQNGWWILGRSLYLPWGPRQALLANPWGYSELWKGRGIQVPCFSNVGGGSHIWAAMMDYPAKGFWEGHSDGISDASMAPHYQRCLTELQGVQPRDSFTVPNHTDHAWQGEAYFTPLSEGEQPSMGIAYPDGEPADFTDANGVHRRTMDHTAAPGKFGDPNGAKSTTDALFLIPAMAHGLEVRDMSEVRRISRTAQGYELTVRNYRRLRRYYISAPVVVLAAGTMNSNALMRQSVDAGALANIPALGHGIGANGDLFGGWEVPDDGSRDASLGPPVHGRIKIKGHEDAGYFILSGGEPAPVPWFQRKKSRAAARRKYNVVAMAQDAADGRFWSEGKRLRFAFDVKGSPAYKRTMAAMEALSRMSGRKVKYLKSGVFTAHPMGGCRISDDTAKGVVNGTGEVHGHPGLIIADASVFPHPAGCPPSLSIAAFASHAAQALIARLDT
ncbi:MAG: GMC oxidoreductase [Pikeienuella sp.]